MIETLNLIALLTIVQASKSHIMATMSLDVSPLSGLPLTRQPVYLGGYLCYTGAPEGQWSSAVSFSPDVNERQARPIKPAAPFQVGSLDLSVSELDKLKALALSYAYQSRLRRLKFPLFVSSNSKGTLDESLPLPQNFRSISVEDLWLEAQRLRLSDKVNETLRNLSDIEPHPGFAHRIAIHLGNLGQDQPEPLDASVQSLVGLAFAAVRGERSLVFQALSDKNLIRIGSNFDYLAAGATKNDHRAGTHISITPEGYYLLEKLKSGDMSLTRSGFLVCRFIKELDDLYDDVYKPVGDSTEVMCPIRRVMDIHHVDKIDDRIMLEINQATVVVVDLTKRNFNVAFEAGYALALGKPIIWTVKAPIPRKLPFDIQSHNVLSYDLTDKDKFRERLTYRILAALEKIKGKSE